MVKQTTNLGEALAAKLTAVLQAHNRVVWLVPGGSNIAISVAAMNLIDAALTSKLVIMQTDERFVPLESAACNWHALQQAGFDTKQAAAYPLLAQGETPEQTVQRYADTVVHEFTAADYIFGQFGIGADGHIAGIKPRSIASTTDQLMCGYQAPDFNRVTLTFPALRQLNEAMAFVSGSEKRWAIETLAQESPPLADFPAGILREIPISTVFNDEKEG